MEARLPADSENDRTADTSKTFLVSNPANFLPALVDRATQQQARKFPLLGGGKSIDTKELIFR